MRPRGNLSTGIVTVFVSLLVAGSVSTAGLAGAATQPVPWDAGHTRLVAAADTPSVSISGSGRYVGYSDGGLTAYLADRRTGEVTALSSRFQGAVRNVRVSADGRYVAWDVSTDHGGDCDPHSCTVIYRENIADQTSQEVFVGDSLVSISADGRYVLGEDANNDSYEQDWSVIDADHATLVTNRFGFAGGISDDGKLVAYTDGFAIHLINLASATDTVVSVRRDGTQSQVYEGQPSLSGDGTTVAWLSADSDLVAHDTNHQRDVFVRDLTTGVTTRASVSDHGAQSDSANGRPVLSTDGRYVVFASAAHSLVTHDTNGKRDVYVRDRLTGTTRRVTISPGGAQANADSRLPAVSADGHHIAFVTAATDLVPADPDGAAPDIFARDIAPIG